MVKIKIFSVCTILYKSLQTCLKSDLRFNEPNFRLVDLKKQFIGFYTPKLYELEVKHKRQIAALDTAVSLKAIFEVRSRAKSVLLLIVDILIKIVINCKLNYNKL